VAHPVYLLEQFSKRERKNPKYMVLHHPKHSSIIDLLEKSGVATKRFDPPEVFNYSAFLSKDKPPSETS